MSDEVYTCMVVYAQSYVKLCMIQILKVKLELNDVNVNCMHKMHECVYMCLWTEYVKDELLVIANKQTN